MEEFENDTIIKSLYEIVFNDKKSFIFFNHEIFNNINEDEQLYILEIISVLLEPTEIIERFNKFIFTRKKTI